MTFPAFYSLGLYRQAPKLAGTLRIDICCTCISFFFFSENKLKFSFYFLSLFLFFVLFFLYFPQLLIVLIDLTSHSLSVYLLFSFDFYRFLHSKLWYISGLKIWYRCLATWETENKQTLPLVIRVFRRTPKLSRPKKHNRKWHFPLKAKQLWRMHNMWRSAGQLEVNCAQSDRVTKGLSMVSRFKQLWIVNLRRLTNPHCALFIAPLHMYASFYSSFLFSRPLCSRIRKRTATHQETARSQPQGVCSKTRL